jgi:hypothetical protein
VGDRDCSPADPQVAPADRPRDGSGDQADPVRLLAVASPLTGHLLPLVPLARALRDAGHDVTVVTGGDGLGACPPS